MWLYISFSPYEHYVLAAASSRKRKAACGPDNMTGRRSAEEQKPAVCGLGGHPVVKYHDTDVGRLCPLPLSSS